MSNIIGFDFSAIADLRESVDVKLTPTKTVTLPLINSRDALKADSLLRKVDLLSSKYMLLMTKIKINEEKMNESKGTEVTDAERSVDLLYKATDSSMQDLEDLTKINDEAIRNTDDILAFIAPYLVGIDVDGVPLIDKLRTVEPRVVNDILMYMLYGAAAQKEEDEEDGVNEAPKTKQE